MAKTKMRGFLLSAMLLLPAAEAMGATDDDVNGTPGTVDYFTPAQQQKALHSAAAAGYPQAKVVQFQDGVFQLNVTKNGAIYGVTVLPTGQVYASTVNPPAATPAH